MKESILQGTTILAVDDNPTNLEALSDYLSEFGCSVLLKLDGEQALTLLDRRLPDLILLDIVMPGIDGFETCQRIKHNPKTKEIPVIFMSALSETVDKVKGFEAGAVDYITKPFQHQEVFSRVKTHLTIGQLQKHLHEKNDKLEDLLKREREALELERKLTKDLRLNLSISLPHELRSPLNIILGFSQLLMDKLDKNKPELKKAFEYASGIHEHGNRLNRLVENSLLYANLKLLKYTPGDRKSLFRETAIEAKRFIEVISQRTAVESRRQNDLILELEPVNIQISPTNFEKILVELLDNAFKFSKAGTSVHIKTTINTRLCILSISDQGQGMNEKQIDTIGAYMQFDRKRHEQQGAGLGLIITSLLAQLEGGVISIDSQLGQGTTVSIVFNCETGVPIQNTLSSRSSSIIGYNGTKLHILIIDTDATVRKRFCDLLVPIGFDITEADGLETGLEKVKALYPDLVFIEGGLLPAQDELTMLRQSPNKFPLDDVMVIAISDSMSENATKRQGERRLYEGVLSMPLNPEEILEIVQQYSGVQWIYQAKSDS